MRAAGAHRLRTARWMVRAASPSCVLRTSNAHVSPASGARGGDVRFPSAFNISGGFLYNHHLTDTDVAASTATPPTREGWGRRACGVLWWRVRRWPTLSTGAAPLACGDRCRFLCLRNSADAAAANFVTTRGGENYSHNIPFTRLAGHGRSIRFSCRPLRLRLRDAHENRILPAPLTSLAPDTPPRPARSRPAPWLPL